MALRRPIAGSALPMLCVAGGFWSIARAVSEVVTIDNFLMAESHHYLGKYVMISGIGKFVHVRNVTEVDPSPESTLKHGQNVIRMNRDTLYSVATFDLTEPATVTKPDVGNRFMSLGFVSETHDIFPSAYEPGRYLLTRDGCGCEPPCRVDRPDGVCLAYGTRYGAVLGRTFADPGNSTDIEEAHRAQDRLTIDQGRAGMFDVPDWDDASLHAVRSHLIGLKDTSSLPPVFGFFKGPEKIDSLYGTLNVAAGWGGMRPADQTYIFWHPDRDEFAPRWSVIVPRVPLVGNGFWSITVYNRAGYMFATPSNYNSAVRGEAGLNPDGSTTVYFGECADPQRSKGTCLPITEGWNILVRFFRPSQAILNGTWVFPVPKAEKLLQI